jgi:hypothetical protein
MGYLKNLLEKISLRNIYAGWDEEKLFGPLVIFALALFLWLYLSKLINSYVWWPVLVVLLFILMVYFPFHRKPIVVFILIGSAGFFVIVGFFAMLYKKVYFSDIKYFAYLWWLSLLLVIVLEYFASKKYGISRVDITIGYLTEKFGSWIIWPLIVVAPLAFLMFAGTFYFLGQEHIFLWAPVFAFWILSGIRIILYQILRKKRK